MLVRRPLANRVAGPISGTRVPVAAPTQQEPFIPGFERTQAAPAAQPVAPPTAPRGAQQVEPCLTGFEPLLTPAQCARLVGVSTSTLQVWRALRKGPAFVKFSRRTVRYQPAAVAAWIAAQQRT